MWVVWESCLRGPEPTDLRGRKELSSTGNIQADEGLRSLNFIRGFRKG